jgi:hypothetical protein
MGQRIVCRRVRGAAAGCLRAGGAAASCLLVLLTSLRAVAAGSPATPVTVGGSESAAAKHIDIIHEGDRSADPAKWNQWRASKGVYRLAMTYQEFYRLTGRPDLAEQDSSRRTLSTVTTVVGFAGFLAGIVIAPWRYFEHDRVGAVLGLALVGGGYATLKVSEHLSRPAIPEAEADELARSYNSTLGQSTGSAAALPGAGGLSLRRYHLSVGIGGAGTGGTGLLVNGAFQ